jgi:putative sigma-54 modulation protein
MKVRITSRHQKLSPKLKEYVEEKIDRMSRYFDRIIDCEVILTREKLHQIVEVNVKVFRTVLHVRAQDADATKAIDECMDKLEVQVKKFKDKLKERPHVKMRDILEPLELEESEE